MSRASFLALAGVLMAGLWLTPRYLSSMPENLGLESPLTGPSDPQADSLPVEIALPKSQEDKPVERVPPSRQSRDALPLYFEPRSAETLFQELRADATPPSEQMEPWSQILLGRLLAIDEMVAKHSSYYGTDYLEQLLAFAAESLFDPLAQGPQVDDRGIGQVGYWAEGAGRRWAGDPESRYFSPDLDPDGDIWDPETNIILATTIFRWVYTSPEVTSAQMAYGIYTSGHSGLRDDGSLDPYAQARVDRAASYRERVTDFFRLKLGIGGEPEHPLTRGILEIDRYNEDGRDTYRALRDFYLEILQDPADVAVAVLLAKETLLYTDLLARGYKEDGDEAYGALLTALLNLEPRIVALGHSPTESLYRETLAEAQQRVSS